MVNRWFSLALYILTFAICVKLTIDIAMYGNGYDRHNTLPFKMFSV